MTPPFYYTRSELVPLSLPRLERGKALFSCLLPPSVHRLRDLASSWPQDYAGDNPRRLLQTQGELIMINKCDVWNNAVEVMQAFAPYYQKEAVQKIEDAHARDVWFVLLLTRGAEPQPLTLDYYQKINPYSSPLRLAEQIEQALSEGFLEEETPGNYRLSLPGRSALDAFFDTAHAGLSQVPTLPTAEMNRLAQLLANIVKATEVAPKPQQKISLASSRWSDPGNGSPAAVKVDQYITDLLRYRDDAHHAAWQPTGVKGLEWESLTLVWKDEANTAAQLEEKLARRGYSENDYAAALHSLAQRNWLAGQDGQFQLTTEGKRIRDNAEDETDRLFYTGWAVLNKSDLAVLDDLLGDLKELLQKNTEDKAVAV